MKKNLKVIKESKTPETNTKLSLLINRIENRELWQIAILILVPFFVYIKTVGFLFVNMDDVAIIVNNFDILGSFKNIGVLFKTDAFLGAHGDYYRPIQSLSFMLDVFIGGEKPWIFHLSNLGYHIFAVVALYYLLRLIKFSKLSAFFGALVLSVHPVLASAVSWVPARGDVLIGLFGILLFISFIKYFSTQKKRYLIIHCLVFIIALFTKETAAFIPVLLVLYFFIVGRRKLNVTNLKQVVPFIAFWILLFLPYYYLRSKVVTGTPPDFIVGIKPFFQNLAAIPSVIGKFIIPIRLSPLPLFEPATTIIGVFILLVVLGFVIFHAIKKNRLVVFGFIWFIAFMIPPMFFKLFYSKYLLEYYEHRAYLPFIGLIIMLTFLLEKFRRNSKLFLGLPVTLVLIFTFIASAHSDHFRNSQTFFGRAMDLGNPGGANNRGEFFMQQGDMPAAFADFNKSIELSDGEYAPAFYNRGIIQSSYFKNHPAAEADLSRAIANDATYINAYIKRAGERIHSSNFRGAFADLEIAKSLDSTNVQIFYTKAKLFTTSLNFKEALPAFNKAIAMDTNSAEMYNDRAYVKYRLAQYSSALEDAEKAISLFPQFINAYYNKGMILLEMQKPQMAINTFDTTLMLADNFYFGHFYRGMARKQMNDMTGACKDWQESVNLGFTMAQDTIKKYCR